MAVPDSSRTASLGRRLTAQDASFLYAESFSGPAHVGMLSFFEGEIPFDRLVGHIEGRLHLLPRYRQRLVPVPLNLAHASLEDDPAFKIENHVKCHRLTPGTSEAEMIQAALRIYEPPLSRSRPLWEMHAFQGVEGGRTGLLWKVHHCLSDGVSAVDLTSGLLDFRADAPSSEPPREPWTPHPLPSPAENLLAAWQDLMEGQVDAAWRAQELLRSPKELAERTRQLGEAARTISRLFSHPIVAAPWNAGCVSARRNLAWARYPFNDIRAIRNAFGGTVNDVVLAMVSEAAARYLAQHGRNPGDLPLRIGCPVNITREDERGTLGNRISMTFPELPATPMEPAERLEAVLRETERINSSRVAQSLELLTEAMNLVPPSLMGLTSMLASVGIDSAAMLSKLVPALPNGRFGIPACGVNFIATNAPGVQVAQYLAGHALLDTISLAPLAGNLGYGVSIFGYNQNLYFGMMAEPRLMPDVELMKSLLDEVFEELKQAAAQFASAEASVGQD